MNKMLAWALNNGKGSEFHPKNWTRVVGNYDSVPKIWNGPTANKVLGLKLPDNFGYGMMLDPNGATLLGGMCLLNTVEMKKIFRKEISFRTVAEFDKWFRSWYPRIDQLHDAVGIPPGFCRNVIYTSEDSFFANRLCRYAGLNKEDIETVLRETHRDQGHAVLKKYLRSFGYNGELNLVFTSEVETELNLTLKIWERLLNKSFQAGDRDFAKAELMYTGFWLDILGIKSGVIYEPASKMVLKGWLKLQNWAEGHKYGTNTNRNLGVVGYLPFLTDQGDGSDLPFSDIPNFQNFHDYNMPPSDYPWYAINLLFNKKGVVLDGPTALSNDKIGELIKYDLGQFYSL